ncbi:hypothetical protein F2Q70_00013915 [Brassica cretica]|uniref:Mitochondrial import inner membrane translocase subunit TIM50 n=1 Tax=Brassica cretica TaxID=69181 RepID=A0A8S9M878_BRACR|nr:hypothetical protein F2Q70_00013915 [Brassica cretica]
MLYSAAIKVPARAIEMYLELRERVEEHVKGFTEPLSEKLLPDLHPSEQNVVYTLVLDLNETLLYTDWKRERGWRTFKRPGVDAFLEHLGKFYEIVVYSDQMDMYVYPVCEKLDPNGYIRYKLARGATKYENGKHYRDLSKLNRDPKRILYVSGNAFETSLQPENCVPIKPYKLESDDTALVDLIPFLEYVARNGPADIRPVLASYERKDVAKEFLERSIEYQKYYNSPFALYVIITSSSISLVKHIMTWVLLELCSVPARAIEMYLELRERVEEHVKGFTEPLSEKLLPDLHPSEQNVVYTLVLDLNETLLYTDWKRERGWRTFKRPGVDAFLEHLGKFYEIVVYSDQMDMYVYPVCEKLDPNGYIRYKLARGATKYENGKHYRDLSKLNRDPKRILYVSGNAFDTSLQPENCVPIKPYKLESDDTALVDLIPFLEYVARNGPADIRPVLASYERKDVAKEFLERSIEYQKPVLASYERKDVAKEFLERSIEYQKRMQGQRQGRLWRR